MKTLELNINEGLAFPAVVLSRILLIASHWIRGIQPSEAATTDLVGAGDYTVSYRDRNIFVTWRPDTEEIARLEQRKRRLQSEMAEVHIAVPPELAGTDKMELAKALAEKRKEAVDELLKEVQLVDAKIKAGAEPTLFVICVEQFGNDLIVKAHSPQFKAVKEIECPPIATKTPEETTTIESSPSEPPLPPSPEPKKTVKKSTK